MPAAFETDWLAACSHGAAGQPRNNFPAAFAAYAPARARLAQEFYCGGGAFSSRLEAHVDKV